jgi:ribosomal protein S18 acetylase RimI-like enzyme
MRPDEADQVVAMIQALAVHIGGGTIPATTAESLRENSDLIDVVVAERSGRIVGACLALLTFSTWRGKKGVYVLDLYIDETERGLGTGKLLLAEAAARGHRRGARFIKLEVDVSNDGAARFYERLGFRRKDEDRLFALEEEQMLGLIEHNKGGAR